MSYRAITVSEFGTTTNYAFYGNLANLPLTTDEIFTFAKNTTASAIEFNQEEESFISFRYSLSTAITTQAPSKVEVTQSGLTIDAPFYTSTTKSAKLANTKWSTSSTAEFGFGNNATYQSTQGYRANLRQYPTAYYNQTSIVNTPSRTIAGSTGWKNEGEVNSFLSGGLDSVFGFDWFVSVSRGVFSLMPGTFIAYDSDFEQVGTVSFSNYSATLSKTDSMVLSSGSTSEITTKSIVLLPQGQASTEEVTQDTVIGCFSLNSYQTAYNSYQAGIYKKKNGDTTGLNFQAESFLSATSVEKYQPVTFFGFGSGHSSQIVWSAARNSVALPPNVS
jgi:hypothetical protein